MNAPLPAPASETFTLFIQSAPKAQLPLGPNDLFAVVQNGLTRSAPSQLVTGAGLTTITSNYVVGPNDETIEANAQGGTFTITIPLGIGSATSSRVVWIVKVDTTINAVIISDGINPAVSAITTPATALGDIGGFRRIYSNGSNLRCFGVG